jgi:hypothetical protein
MTAILFGYRGIFIAEWGVEIQNAAIMRTWGAAVLPYTFGDDVRTR